MSAAPRRSDRTSRSDNSHSDRTSRSDNSRSDRTSRSDNSRSDSSRRSDSTRAAILAAARERFATDGYERATIRAIAADASIDPSMVMRYYGSKEKLFAAAADFDLHLPDLGQVPREQIATTLVGHFLRVWEKDEKLWALLRAGATNDGAAHRIQEIFSTQLGPAVASIVADPDEASTRAGLLATQMLGFALCRYVLRLPPVVSLRQEEAVAWLAPTVQRYLTSDTASSWPFGSRP